MPRVRDERWRATQWRLLLDAANDANRAEYDGNGIALEAALRDVRRYASRLLDAQASTATAASPAPAVSE